MTTPAKLKTTGTKDVAVIVEIEDYFVTPGDRGMTVNYPFVLK